MRAATFESPSVIEAMYGVFNSTRNGRLVTGTKTSDLIVTLANHVAKPMVSYQSRRRPNRTNGNDLERIAYRRLVR